MEMKTLVHVFFQSDEVISDSVCVRPVQRCEKLTLLLFCHTLSAPFHEPVSPLVSPTHFFFFFLIEIRDENFKYTTFLFLQTQTFLIISN